MGLFKWFKTNQQQVISGISTDNGLEIPEDLFIEKRDPHELDHILSSNGEAKGINTIYAFLMLDYESKGYNDALVNHDQSNRVDGIKLIKLTLKIRLDKEINSCEKTIKDLEYHIKSVNNAGLLDLVEELNAQKEKTINDVKKIRDIDSQIDNNSGLFEKVTLSYEQGFKRSIAAITKSKFQ